MVEGLLEVGDRDAAEGTRGNDRAGRAVGAVDEGCQAVVAGDADAPDLATGTAVEEDGFGVGIEVRSTLAAGIDAEAPHLYLEQEVGDVGRRGLVEAEVAAGALDGALGEDVGDAGAAGGAVETDAGAARLEVACDAGTDLQDRGDAIGVAGRVVIARAQRRCGRRDVDEGQRPIGERVFGQVVMPATGGGAGEHGERGEGAAGGVAHGRCPVRVGAAGAARGAHPTDEATPGRVTESRGVRSLGRGASPNAWLHTEFRATPPAPGAADRQATVDGAADRPSRARRSSVRCSCTRWAPGAPGRARRAGSVDMSRRPNGDW